ncbi:hypothetical protein Bca52824_008741 [Brassica carinata]|uniref:Uncharacterized protein n=1 Tax=Brassica carinata TaxID=52824 RepID=A0A8X7W8L7_BRACI|nr:hypothetical protein Bca52824_008741 [Brassica carinata]
MHIGWGDLARVSSSTDFARRSNHRDGGSFFRVFFEGFRDGGAILGVVLRSETSLLSARLPLEIEEMCCSSQEHEDSSRLLLNLPSFKLGYVVSCFTNFFGFLF